MKTIKPCHFTQRNNRKISERGFTLIEFLISAAIMLVVILGILSLYMDSNRVSVDQQQFTDTQHNVRAAMYFVSRDFRSLGAGLPEEFAGHYLQGINNDPNQASHTFQTDRLTILGNADPLRLQIQSYSPGTGTLVIEPNEFLINPYTATSYPADPLGYINRIVLILPNASLNNVNGELAQITGVDLIGNQISFTTINVTLPNLLQPGGASSEYVGGSVHFIELKTYWLDVDGSYTGLSAGTDGYLGEPGIMYVSRLNPATATIEHQPLAGNIEDLQFQYHGDLDGDEQLDDNNSNSLIDMGDFLNWDDLRMWTDDPVVVAGIRRIRIFILGRTENPAVSIGGKVPVSAQYIYGKPAIADSPQGAQADKHRRFLLDTTSNVRNMSLNVYNYAAFGKI
ncbi:prepilin-type N-terminal cleavage/methylation domain-containing protein [Acidobacteriota bacterium]